MTSVGIIGLGLIGGSLARDLAAAGWRVLGADQDPDTLRAATDDGVVSGAMEPQALATLDLLVLALPVRAAAHRLRELAAEVDPGSELVITDAGSTKRSILAAADASGVGTRFVGSHPMAGSHRSGWQAGQGDLFRQRTVWICPADASTGEAVERVEAMWRTVGAVPARIDAVDHDRLMARTSHLPQLAVTALATVLSRHGLPPDALGPGGRDTTRLAGSDPDMWTDIALDNRDEIAPALDALTEALTELTRAIRDGDAAAVRSRLQASRDWSNP